MTTKEDRYERALDEIRDAQGDKWLAYSGDDIQSAEEQSKVSQSESEHPCVALIIKRRISECEVLEGVHEALEEARFRMNYVADALAAIGAHEEAERANEIRKDITALSTERW